MIALVVIIAASFAMARWMLVGGMAGGVILATILILHRRSRRLGEPRDDLPIVLFARGLDGREAEADMREEDRGPITREPGQQSAVS